MNPSTTRPSRRAYTAGIDCAWKAAAICGFSSMLTLVSTTWPSVASTTFSMMGPSVRHGPHHGAHRSTTTAASCERSMTSVWKVASVTSMAMRRRLPALLTRPAGPRRRPSAASVAVVERPGDQEVYGAPATATAPAGIDVVRVSAWLAEHVPGATAPFIFDLIAGGHSNLTYRVTDAEGHRVVLRRPPLGHVLPSAHDMGREHRIIAALADTLVPVPPAVAYCDDRGVTGAAFYVMGYVDALVLHTPGDAELHLSPAARRDVSDAMVDTMATLHAVDPIAVGLGDLGRTEGYIARQLKRWHGQWEAQKTREL